MKIVDLNICAYQNAIATIGSFDGMHLGHQALINNLNNIAHSSHYKRVIISFEPLPLEYFYDQAGISRIARLSLLRDKVAIWQKLFDQCVILYFNSTTSQIAADDFVKQVLQHRLNIKHMVIGDDFKFGYQGLGTKNTLIAQGIQVNEFKTYYKNTLRISSTLIRNLAQNNELIELRKYLGHNIRYTSRVIYGQQLGTKYGVPTINLNLGHNRPALWGIYVALVHIEGVSYHATASIGKNPTVSTSDNYKLEAHLLDINLNLYGKIATIELIQFIRVELKFDSLESLFKQIHYDLDYTRNFFKFTNYRCIND